MKKFKHSGDLGDIIFSLPTIRALGGGILYLDPTGGKKEPLVEWGIRSGEDKAVYNNTKLTKKGIDSIKSLLEYQDYINGVEYWEGQPFDYNLDEFRKNIAYNNLSDSHLAAFSLPFTERDEKWLDVPAPIMDDPNKNIVFARSCRYHSNYPFWEMMDREYIKRAMYIGHEKEYEYFQYTYPHMKEVPHRKVESLLEMAQIIQGASVFIGNQGLPHAIAEGLKGHVINEVFRPYPAAIFKREGAQYV